MEDLKPDTFLTSTLVRYRELEEQGLTPEQRLSAIKHHIIVTLDAVKDYQFQTLDQLIYAAFIAANSVQDVRLYSLEAELENLKEEGSSIGKLFLEIFLVVAFEVGLVSVAGSLILGAFAFPVVGYLLHLMNKPATAKRFLREIGKEAFALENTIIRHKQEVVRLEKAWDESVERLMTLQFGRYHSSQENKEEIIEIVQHIRDIETASGDVGADLAIARAERALHAPLGLPEIYDKYRGPDTLSGTLRLVHDHYEGRKQESLAGEFVPTYRVGDLTSELQGYKIQIINESAYNKALIMNHPEETSFFSNPDIKRILAELDDLYPRIIYIFYSSLKTVNQLADLFEIGIWSIYLMASGVLSSTPVTRDVLVESDRGLLFNGSVLLRKLEADYLVNAPLFRITGDQFVGIDKLADQQAHCLFRKFVEGSLQNVREKIYNYVALEEGTSGFLRLDPERTRDLIDELVVPGIANSIDERENDRDFKLRLLKLCVILFFQILDQNLSALRTKSDQFGRDTPFEDLLRVRPPEPEESPPSLGSPPEDPNVLSAPLLEQIRRVLRDGGYATVEQLRPERLLNEAVNLMQGVANVSFGTVKVEYCERIRDLLDALKNLDLSPEHELQLKSLENTYENSACTRPPS